MGRRADDIRMRFGKRLLERREAKELSQETFAGAAGLDRTYRERETGCLTGLGLGAVPA